MASVDVLLPRIEQRGRDYEQAFDRTYLEAVQRSYAEAFRDYDDAPLLVVDTSEADLMTDEAIRAGLWAAIDDHQAGVRHWKP